MPAKKKTDENPARVKPAIQYPGIEIFSRSDFPKHPCDPVDWSDYRFRLKETGDTAWFGKPLGYWIEDKYIYFIVRKSRSISNGHIFITVLFKVLGEWRYGGYNEEKYYCRTMDAVKELTERLGLHPVFER